MADVLEIIAAIEWIVAGVAVFVCLRKWNKRFSDIYSLYKKELEDIERENARNETS